VSECLSPSQIEAFVAGELPARDRGRVVEHLGSCTSCGALVAARRDARSDEGSAETQATPRSDETILQPPTPAATQVSPGSARANQPGGAPQIAGYRIQGLVSTGGQGAVYKAVQQATHRTVALKVLHGGTFPSPRALARFEREVDLAASMRHPNIVTIYDSGVAAGCPYYAMEYIHGLPLTAYVRDKRLGVRALLALFHKVCAAIAFAHQRGVIHRDLKPGNVLVDATGEPRIVDFGLAKAAGSRSEETGGPLTETGEFLGTAAYASPEQMKRDPSLVDIRTDVYALGVMLYELLTGHYPYPVSGSISDVARWISEREPERPGTWYRGARPSATDAALSASGLAAQRIDNEVETIVLKCLKKEPVRRYQSAAELAADIGRYLAGEAIEAKRDSSLYVLGKLARKNAYATAVVALVMASIVAFGLVSLNFYRGAVAARGDAQRLAAQATEDQRLARIGAEAAKLVGRRWLLAVFLLEWHADQHERAMQRRESIDAGTPELAVVDLILDERRAPEELPRGLTGRAAALADFAAAERFVKLRQPEAAVAAYQRCLANLDGADTGLRVLVQARLDLLRPGLDE